MAIWIPPSKFKSIEQAEFEAQRDKYIAKNGYTIRIPGFRDIVKVNVFQDMTEDEIKAWKNKDKSFFSPERYEDIRLEKQRRKERYLAMLSSPQPAIFRARAELATAIDNVQDATSTFAWLTWLGMKAAPKFIAKAAAGPIGWMLTAADAFNLARTVITPELSGMKTKRHVESLKKFNHTSTTVSAKIFKLDKRMKFSKGKLIEAAQVSGDFLGFGLTLGALMALPYDIIFGGTAYLKGQKVKISLPIPKRRFYELLAMKALKGAYAFAAMPAKIIDTDIISMLTGIQTITNILQASKWAWDALISIDKPDELMISGAQPRNPLTDEAIEDVHAGSKSKPDYILPGQDMLPLNEYLTQTSEALTNQLNKYFEDNKFNDNGYIASQAATITALQNLAAYSDDGKIQVDTMPAVKFIMDLLERNEGIGEMREKFLPAATRSTFFALNKTPGIYDFKEAYQMIKSTHRNAIIPYGIKSMKEYKLNNAISVLGIDGARFMIRRRMGSPSEETTAFFLANPDFDFIAFQKGVDLFTMDTSTLGDLNKVYSLRKFK
jgi:hypothetical protein